MYTVCFCTVLYNSTKCRGQAPAERWRYTRVAGIHSSAGEEFASLDVETFTTTAVAL
jgi:hypothetical protein